MHPMLVLVLSNSSIKQHVDDDQELLLALKQSESLRDQLFSIW